MCNCEWKVDGVIHEPEFPVSSFVAAMKDLEKMLDIIDAAGKEI